MINIDNLPTFQLDNRAKDLTGIKQGELTFIKPAERKNNRIYWWAQCSCGEIEKVRADSQRKYCKKCVKKEISKKVKGKSRQDLTGKKYGRLTVLYCLGNLDNKGIKWHCKCDCGNEIDVLGSSLKSGNTQSCGCLKKEHAYFTSLKKDLVGQRFGHLTVIAETDQRQYEKVVWKCQCDCGKIVFLNTVRLTQGNDISCGCQKMSYGATQIEKTLKNNNIKYIKEYSNKDLSLKKFDFALIDNNNNILRLIEFDGEQHYRYTGGWNTKENFIKRKQYDKIKNEYALSHNIPLVRIPYWKRDNITLDMILGDQYLITTP